MEYSRKLLDELMGPGRNLDHRADLHFYEEQVCKDHLVDFCPKDLFVNTKSDLGQCFKVHDDKLKAMYQHAPDREQYDYERKFCFQLGMLIRDLERRIRRSRERMNIEKQTQAQVDERKEKIVMLEEKIKAMQQRIEICGEEGEIDEAKELTAEVDQLLHQLNHLKSYETKERKNEVCDTCGAIVVANEAQERKEAHLAGKQHMGYTRIRETYEVLRKKYEGGSEAMGSYRDDRRPPPPPSRGNRGGEYRDDRGGRGGDFYRGGRERGDDYRGGDRREYPREERDRHDRRRSRSPPRRDREYRR